ncbi:RimK family alpha-L-glutamate ligase [Myxococcus sp. CA051A]|uniref:ATP-grasp domain-containing protein n=1 Tax=unclassified Myxococcus TaxID=2648731 RepID=UPI00157B5163|nr:MULTISPECIES: RimK family alpha-L-glutamate ligase [unclassified Myxococcus]NTX14267.1 RimK family alpha-L-glutamate ligase [Myxococcus sp. CA056]NTX35336.1 RimK family alpha-L-glutamate ligase [Myxococcus sp. CA033]NTX62249.1 RimK family alpha-L-glutamate ligase [Myxococcus sp. CA051A]
MKVTLLSRSASIPSTRRLVEAGRARGHKMRVLNPLRVQMHLDGGSATLYYDRKKLSPTDVVLPRIAQSINTYGLAVVNQFALGGVPLVNHAQAIAQSRSKMRSLQLLSAHGIDIPATVMARDAAHLKEMVGLVGGVPVLVKLLQGQENHGVMVCESLQSLEAALEAVLGLGHNLVMQEYVKSTSQDVRVLVVGGKAVAAVRRRARPGRFAHTLIKGARLEAMELSPGQRATAEKATRLVGLEVAAVDLLDVQGQSKVFEVNSSPALPEMEAVTGMDLATPIIIRAEELVAGADPVSVPDLLPPRSLPSPGLPTSPAPRRKRTSRTPTSGAGGA